MLKKLGMGLALTLALGLVPMPGHAQAGNGCLAQGEQFNSIVIGSFSSLTCKYTAKSATGVVAGGTLNAVTVTYERPLLDENGNPVLDENGNPVIETVRLYDKDVANVPTFGQWNDPRSVDRELTLTVVAYSGLGALGVVAAGDAS